ncbi:protein tyrosine kinase domain-containing protein [Ditylenchus destructor]|uniref:Protein tyrosine kinase domain-containing protein n=1 Tax=Ditylenchus destructor TaxID=166010 RepID=A0AAD4NHW8_9BILA|nr:protein tyrosine kinase domain-containing protein [Ditylenchus destructor]
MLNVTTLNHTQCSCSEESYLTPWSTVIAMFLLYFIALFWFCRHGKKVCHPSPDSIYPYKSRLKFLRRALDHLLVDDMFIELTDSKLGQGAVGFVFKGYVYPKSQTRFKQKTFAAVKPQKSIGLLEEAARMARLNHSNIVRLIARKEERESVRVYVKDIVHILRQVGSALKYIHESKDQAGNEFTHGDVAARNVLLTGRKLDSTIAKLGDFGLPIDFGPRLPIPWLPPEIVCSLDRANTKHRPESDVWMFGVLAWECATLGAERTFEEIQHCFTLPHRGLPCPANCPPNYSEFVLECFSEQHRRPRFAGAVDSNLSAVGMLDTLEAEFRHSTLQFKMIANVSNCTCAQHRCNVPLPPFSIGIR